MEIMWCLHNTANFILYLYDTIGATVLQAYMYWNHILSWTHIKKLFRNPTEVSYSGTDVIHEQAHFEGKDHTHVGIMNNGTIPLPQIERKKEKEFRYDWLFQGDKIVLCPQSDLNVLHLVLFCFAGLNGSILVLLKPKYFVLSL